MLDREVQAEHVLEVRISDNGTPPLNSTTRVVVQVTDENDNKPEFLEKFYKVILFLQITLELDYFEKCYSEFKCCKSYLLSDQYFLMSATFNFIFFFFR